MSDRDVRVLATPQLALEALNELTDWAEEISFAFAWVSTGPHWDAIVRNLGKISSALVGTHFHQTDPVALGFLVENCPAGLRLIEEKSRQQICASHRCKRRKQRRFQLARWANPLANKNVDCVHRRS